MHSQLLKVSYGIIIIWVLIAWGKYLLACEMEPVFVLSCIPKQVLRTVLCQPLFTIIFNLHNSPMNCLPYFA